MFPRPKRKAFFVGKCHARRVINIFEWEGDVEWLERMLGENSGPKYLAIDGVKSMPKCRVAAFFCEVVRMDEGETVANKIPVVL